VLKEKMKNVRYVLQKLRLLGEREAYSRIWAVFILPEFGF
jgi:hypothetical protein